MEKYQWTPEADRKLILLLKHETHANAAKRLGLSKQQVMRRAKLLGFTKSTPELALNPDYTPEEDAFIIANAAKGSRFIAEHIYSFTQQFARSVESIKMRAKRLRESGKLSQLGDKKHYSDAELAFVQFTSVHAKELSYEKIGMLINRSADSVRHHSPAKKDRKVMPEVPPRQRWSKPDEEKLVSIIDSGLSYADAGESLPERTLGALATRYKTI